MSHFTLRLLDGFKIAAAGRSVNIPHDAQRVVAFLALRGRRLPRDFVAGTLWIDGTQERANGNLRSALWRIRRLSSDLVTCSGRTLALGADVAVDVVDVTCTALELCAGQPSRCDFDDLSCWSRQLLPEWDDEWLAIERERLRQESLHALETIADRLTSAGRHGKAIQVALLAVRSDPLRESAHRCVVRIHLAEGNRSAALQHTARYRRTLHDALGVEPSERITELVNFSCR